jgi:hypothetical protein
VPHRPWVAFAPAVTAAPDPEATLRRLVEIVRDGSGEVVIQAPSAVPAGKGRVTGVRRGREAVEIDAEADGDGLLVVNDAWWPGWRARVDGVETTMVPADVLVRGVVVPKGRHTVALSYEPPEVKWGLAVSAVALIGAAAMVLGPLLRRSVGRAPRAG